MSPDLASSLPPFLAPFDPLVQGMADYLLRFHEWSGFSWPVIMGLVCIGLRASLLPLFFVQTKIFTQIFIKHPEIKRIMQLAKTSHMSRKEYFKLYFSLFRKTSAFYGLKPFRLFLYNVIHFPVLILVILSLRRAVMTPGIREQSFLWMANSYTPDPYFIIPLAACALFYYTFGMGINVMTRDTPIGRLRMLAQKMMILWLIFLSHWPGSLAFYVLCNAMFSVAQVKFMSQPAVMLLSDPKSFLTILSSQIQNKHYQDVFQKVNAMTNGAPDDRKKEETVVEEMKLKLKSSNIKIK